MNVKTDTKKKFTILTLLDKELPANMAGELSIFLQSRLQEKIPHIVLNFSHVNELSPEVGEAILFQQQLYYEKHFSFVICCLTEDVEDFLERNEILELLNVTPTESEAWDIVQMEEIEREIMGGEDESH